jgi:S-(hydroxymethyl)glutathione dehydrogenase / alcohol dehydrogenase
MTKPYKTRAVVLDRPGVLPTVEDVVVDEPGRGEVRVRLAASGVCHTDIATVRDARYWPLVLGHEGAGVVESLGAGVTNVKVGDPVVINWRVACGHCHWCEMGRQDLCENVQGTAEPRVHRPNGEPLQAFLNAGTFCEYAVVPAQGAVVLPAQMPLDKASLIGCAVATGVGAALHTSPVQAGQSVVVFGTGGVGLNVVQGARLARAGIIIAVDRTRSKLDMAVQFGATHTLLAEAGDTVQEIMRLTGMRGVDHAFEVVGLPALMQQALDTLATGGMLTLVGAAARDALLQFHPRAFMSKQQTIRGCIYGSCRPALDFPLFARWYLQKQLMLDELLTETITLGDVPRLFSVPPAADAVRSIVLF